MLKSSDSVEEVKESSDKETDALNQLRTTLEDIGITRTDNYLRRYLYGTDYNVDEAFKKIKACNDQIMLDKGWYRMDTPLKIRSNIEMDTRAMLPDCDKEGRPIYLMKNGNIDVSKMDLFDVVSIDDVWIEMLLNKHPECAAKGLCAIIDIKDQSWKLNKWMRPDYIKQSMTKIENLPFKDYKVHVINNSWWISIGIKLIWPFLPQKFKDMMKFHFDDMETLYQYVDRKVLPIEYGGLKEIKYSELYEDLYKKNDEIFQSFEAYRTIKKEKEKEII